MICLFFHHHYCLLAVDQKEQRTRAHSQWNAANKKVNQIENEKSKKKKTVNLQWTDDSVLMYMGMGTI